jgi:hypothetical protein
MKRYVVMYVGALVLGAVAGARYSLFLAPMGAVLATLVAWKARSVAAVRFSRASTRGIWRGIGLLGNVWGSALVIASVLYAVYKSSPVEAVRNDAFSQALNHFLLFSGLIGGVFATLRSSKNEEHSESTHKSVEALASRVADMNHNRARLAELAVEAHSAGAPEAVLSRLTDMLNLAVRLPDTSKHADSMSLWARDQTQWFVMLSTHEESVGFSQDVVSNETPGAGVVANMAATGATYFLERRGVEGHKWWKANSASSRTNRAMAAVLLRDSSGQPIGALCLTSERDDALEAGDRTENLENLLRFWGVNFTLGLEALRRFEGGSDAT